ncbi:MAG: right-handed parallel beta-helix repeat-containing protein [bacterium]
MRFPSRLFSCLLLLGAGLAIGSDLVETAPLCDVCRPPTMCGHYTIQGAINGAAEGTTIWVCSGTYSEHIDFQGKSIQVRSRSGPETTIIDGGGSGTVVTFDDGEGADSVLDGFTIQNGEGTDIGTVTGGGGILCDGASPTISNCVITDNGNYGGLGIAGGGVYLRDSSPAFQGCDLYANHAYNNGGGLYCESSSPRFDAACTIRNNVTLGVGGGVYADAGSSPSFSGMTFTWNTAQGPDPNGGAAYFDGASPTVDECTFANNYMNEGIHEGSGAALYFDNAASGEVRDSTFTDNEAQDEGGGIYINNGSTPLVTGCTFTGNSAILGGAGVGIESSSPTITGCTFSGNETTSSGSYGGGALLVSVSAAPVIESCTITGNTSATIGGGISCQYWANPTVTGCTIEGNTAPFGGGLSFAEDSTGTVAGSRVTGNDAEDGGGAAAFLQSSPTFTNCEITGNTAGGDGGGAFYVSNGALSVVNSTISGNSATGPGGAVGMLLSTVSIANSILWGDTAGGTANEIDVWSGDSPLISYSDVQGGWDGDGNINLNPLFVGGGDFHLSLISPCIDAGDPASAPPDFPADDIDGESRPQDLGYDMGADEYSGDLCADVDGDGYPARDGCGAEQDCNDGDAAIHPGADEVCDGIDNDCSGIKDEGCYARIQLYKNGTFFRTGQTLEMQVETFAGEIPAVVDVYIALYLPWHSLIFFPTGTTTPVPVISNWPVVDWGPYTFFRWTLPSSLPKGVYVWLAFFTEHKSYRIVGVGDYEYFVFTP